jgi:glycine oxidase
LTSGCVEARAVVAAAGAWTGQLGAPLAKFAPMRPVRGQTILLRARVRPSHILKRRGIYLIPRDDDTLLLGATTEPDSGYCAHPTAAGFAELMAAGRALVPALADAEAIYAGAGLRPEPGQGRPILGGIPGVTGLYVAAGHYKTGIGFAAVTSRVMAELIADGAATIDLAPFVPRAPDAVALFQG